VLTRTSSAFWSIGCNKATPDNDCFVANCSTWSDGVTVGDDRQLMDWGQIQLLSRERSGRGEGHRSSEMCGNPRIDQHTDLFCLPS
jgi:hypothetical protein